ncbi:hypothetical protein [Cupriavidus malaysiensis]|uniref:hypothetical protein n=1 Tax=Cupriavidus malaysiensis TaxID=367825 RepID=UPI0012FFBA43|nr:hypothetical protein [Cupriavidus malaysiensis]
MTSIRFSSSFADDFTGLGLQGPAVLFHGDAIDERGELAIQNAKEVAQNHVPLSYDPEQMELTVSGSPILAERCEEIFANYRNSSFLFEATTLGFAELYCGIRAAIKLQVPQLNIVYVEPDDYSRSERGSDEFALTDVLTGYRPIPPAIVDLTSPDVEAGVFFLGFEPARLDRALEEYQMIVEKDIKILFGLPAFKAGWELHSIVPHLTTLKERGSFAIAYCAANDPEAAFEALQNTRASLSAEQKMFIAPIGTKPCGIAAAIFASLYQDQVGLVYDHPRRKPKRSAGVNVWRSFGAIFEYFRNGN